MMPSTPICLTTVTIILVYATKETSGNIQVNPDNVGLNLQVATDNDGLIVIASYQALAIIGILKLLIGILFLVDSEMYFFKRKRRDLLRGTARSPDSNLRPPWLTGLLGCGMQLVCDFQRFGYDFVSEDELIRSVFGRKPEVTPFQPSSDLPDTGYDNENDLIRPLGKEIKLCRQLFTRCPLPLRKMLEV